VADLKHRQPFVVPTVASSVNLVVNWPAQRLEPRFPSWVSASDSDSPARTSQAMLSTLT
jgi:hypothetical protein